MYNSVKPSMRLFISLGGVCLLVAIINGMGNLIGLDTVLGCCGEQQGIVKHGHTKYKLEIIDVKRIGVSLLKIFYCGGCI